REREDVERDQQEERRGHERPLERAPVAVRHGASHTRAARCVPGTLRSDDPAGPPLESEGMGGAGHDEPYAPARAGDRDALSKLFALHQPRLVRMVELRLDARLRRRLDPTDVVQEAWLEVVERFPRWSAVESPPFRAWLRLTTGQALSAARRRHL